MSAKPQRIQRRRTKGWRIPPGAVYVGRPTKWGNPWRVQSAHWLVDEYGHETHCAPGEARGVAVRLYREAVTTGRPPFDELDPAELRGLDLVCWCPPVDAEGRRVACHADVLLELANRPGAEAA